LQINDHQLYVHMVLCEYFHTTERLIDYLDTPEKM